MDGQMTIFDFLPQTDDFCTMSESDVMNIISKRIGIRLVYDRHLEEYAAKVGKVRISAEISKYKCTHDGTAVIAGHTFIGCGWGTTNAGGGSPCNSIDEAVTYLAAAIGRAKQKKEG